MIRYLCHACKEPLFSSEDQFDCGIDRLCFRKAGNVTTEPDRSFAIYKTGVYCASCKARLGNVYDDGKFCGDTHPEAGRRYSIKPGAVVEKKE